MDHQANVMLIGAGEAGKMVLCDIHRSCSETDHTMFLLIFQ